MTCTSRRPAFVVVEGIDRAGKDGVASRLVERLKCHGIPAVKLTIPDYDTPDGKLIAAFLAGERQLVHAHVGRQLVEAETAFVFECLHVCHKYAVAHKVREALSDGKWVVCSRWKPSAILYGQEDGIDPRWIIEVCSFLPEPDLSVLIDADPAAIGLRRDRASLYEKDADKQARLAAGYREMWKLGASVAYGKVPKSWAVISGAGARGDVFNRMWNVVLERLIDRDVLDLKSVIRGEVPQSRTTSERR